MERTSGATSHHSLVTVPRALLRCVDLHRFTWRAVAVFVVGEELDLRSGAPAVETERGVVIMRGSVQFPQRLSRREESASRVCGVLVSAAGRYYLEALGFRSKDFMERPRCGGAHSQSICGPSTM